MLMLASQRSLFDAQLSLLASQTSLFDNQMLMLASQTSLFDNQLSLLSSQRSMFDNQMLMLASQTSLFDNQLSLLSSQRSMFDNQLSLRECPSKCAFATSSFISIQSPAFLLIQLTDYCLQLFLVCWSIVFCQLGICLRSRALPDQVYHVY